MAKETSINIDTNLWSTIVNKVSELVQSSLGLVGQAIDANTQRNKDDNDLLGQWSRSNSEWSAKVLTSKDNTMVIVCGTVIAIVLIAWIIKQKT